MNVSLSVEVSFKHAITSIIYSKTSGYRHPKTVTKRKDLISEKEFSSHLYIVEG